MDMSLYPFEASCPGPFGKRFTYTLDEPLAHRGHEPYPFKASCPGPFRKRFNYTLDEPLAHHGHEPLSFRS